MIRVCSQDKGKAGPDDAGHIFADPAAVLPYLQGIGRGEEFLAGGVQENTGGQVYHAAGCSQPFHVLFRSHIHVLNHIHTAVNAVLQALAADTMGCSGDAQARAFADSGGDFLRAEKAGHKGADWVRNTGGYEKLQQVRPFFQVLTAGMPDFFRPAVRHSYMARSVASLHADACRQKAGAVNPALLNQFLHGHIYVILIPHAPGCGDSAHQVVLKTL